MSFNQPGGPTQRQGRFSNPGQSGVEQGFQDASTVGDGLDRKFIKRNLKPYKTLRRFTKKKGLKGLKNKNFAQLESLAAKAVLKKAKIKSKPLSTTVKKGKGKGKFTGKQIRRGRRQLRKLGKDAYKVGSTAGIKNKKVRRAANHLRQIRRNRAVNKTQVGSAKAYDIWKGYRRK